MSNNAKNDLVEKLAKGNSVDLVKIALVESQLSELEKAGVVRKHEYSLDRPLGRLVQAAPHGTFANVGRPSSR